MATTMYPETQNGSGRFFHRNRVERVATVTTAPTARTWSVSSSAWFRARRLAVLVSAWGALVPYLGPGIGFSADGSSSWHWSLSHALLGLVPGAVGVAVGLALMVAASRRRRAAAGWASEHRCAAFSAYAAGAWFVVGPLAWTAMYGGRSFFVTAGTPVRQLEYWVGYAMGPGLLLAAAGAFALGWAIRHDRPLGATPGDAPAEMAAVPGDEPSSVGAGAPDRVVTDIA